MIPKNWNFKVALCAPEVQRLLTSNWSELKKLKGFSGGSLKNYSIRKMEKKCEIGALQISILLNDSSLSKLLDSEEIDKRLEN